LVENRRTKDSKRKIQTIKISKRKWLSIEPVDNLVICMLETHQEMYFFVFISNGKWWSIESHKNVFFHVLRLILKCSWLNWCLESKVVLNVTFCNKLLKSKEIEVFFLVQKHFCSM
jgi:hypothetical protein